MSENENEIASPKQPRSSLIGFDSLLEDVFGLNIRSFRSIGTLFTRPHKYFEAARDADWLRRFTPSFRVWFGLTALTAAMRFIWAGPDTPSAQAYRLVVDSIIESANSTLQAEGQMISMSDQARNIFAADILKWMIAISPFIIITLTALLATFYKAWGEKLTYVVRLRYLFGIIITGAFVGFLSAFLMQAVPTSIYQQINLALLVLIFILYFDTAFRGPYKTHTLGSRLTLSSLVTFLMIIITMLGIFLAMAASLFISVRNNLPAPVPVT